ncbi:MAG: sulfatase [Caldilineaceae bacterium]|nr:sulfatase [Caldilineaceae bacterium]
MPETRPNLLVVFCDQLRRDAIAAFGDPNVETPHIDRLAQNGVSFTNACSSYPICVPFRFTLMTGEYAHSRFVPGIEWRMSPAERTLADEFNAGGYESIYLGKWHLYGGHALLPGHSTRKANLTPVPRVHQGRWQKWLGFELRNGHFDTCYYEDDDPTPRPIETYQTDGLFNLAMEHLEDRRDTDKPFACVISVEPPHFPYEAPAALEARWKDRPMSVPPSFQARDQEERERFLTLRRLYYAMVENLDMNVGRLRAWLEKTGLAQDTIVVFFSDHGEMGGCHGIPTAHKQYPYEESIGIPLIVHDPRYPERANLRLPAPTCTEDLFPTLLGLCGLEPANSLPGTNLAPLIRNEDAGPDRPGVLLEYVAETRANSLFHVETWRGFRSERFKYTVLGDVNGGKPWQFFDLETDPHEMNNLIDDPAWEEEIRCHHGWMRDRMVETEDLYILKPAWGMEGLNIWDVDVPRIDPAIVSQDLDL